MKVITLLNEKGGVGKTTTAIHVAAGLAQRGHRVVLVDSDAQANATALCQVKSENGLYELLVHDAEWRNVLRVVPSDVYSNSRDRGTFAILPSNIETRVIPMIVDDPSLLNERIDELRDYTDYVIFDTSPTPSLLHGMIYMATDYMVYPTKCEYLSIDGLAKGVGRLELLNKNKRHVGLPEAQLLGIQPTMYDARTNAHDYGLSLIVKEFKRKAWPAIPVRTIFRDASWACKTIWTYESDDRRGQAELIQIMDAMVNRVLTGVRSA